VIALSISANHHERKKIFAMSRKSFYFEKCPETHPVPIAFSMKTVLVKNKSIPQFLTAPGCAGGIEKGGETAAYSRPFSAQLQQRTPMLRDPGSFSSFLPSLS